MIHACSNPCQSLEQNRITCPKSDSLYYLQQQWQEKMPSHHEIFEYKHSSQAVFHAKGLWICHEDGLSMPCVTQIGSSNYGMRSVLRDIESQTTVLTRDTALRGRINQVRHAHLYVYRYNM